MKSVIYLLLLFFLAGVMPLQAQTLHYQGVARNATGTPLANTSIAIRLSMKDARENGNTLYTETKSVSTNGFGLYSVSINDGTGTRTGDFTAIDWSQQRFIQTEMDPENGTAFSDLGTAPLHSVSQALNALQAATLKGIPEPKEGYYIEYKNGQWVQKPKPKKYTANGVGFNPSSTTNFMGPTCTITVEEDNPVITISTTKIVGTQGINSGGVGLNISLGYKKTGEAINVPPVSLIGSVFVNGVNIPENTRIPVSLSGAYPTEFKAGEQYTIGMIGYSNSWNSWNNNGSGSIFVEVSY